MPRSKNLVASKARRKRIINLAKGYRGKRKNVWTVAKNAVQRAMRFAYIGRKLKKRDFRSIWIQRINAGLRSLGYSYSKFMGLLISSEVNLNRKVLADLAMNDFAAFEQVVKKVVG